MSLLRNRHIERVKAEELSENALNRFRKEAAKSGRVDEGVLSDTNWHLLQDLRLIDDAGHLNRAAVLLFHPDPERYVFGAYIKSVRSYWRNGWMKGIFLSLNMQPKMEALLIRTFKEY